MAKINLEIFMNNEFISIKGIKNKNNIIYKNANVTVNISLNEKIVNLKEESPEFKLELIFDKKNKTKANYLLKKYQKNIEFLIETKKLIIDNNYLEITYKVDSEQKFIKMKFEEI